MPTIWIKTTDPLEVINRQAAVAFKYDSGAVDIVKTIPDRKWMPEHIPPCWTIPVSYIDLLGTLMTEAGHEVRLNGSIWGAEKAFEFRRAEAIREERAERDAEARLRIREAEQERHRKAREKADQEAEERRCADRERLKREREAAQERIRRLREEAERLRREQTHRTYTFTPPPRASAGEWAEELLGRCSPALGKKVFQALTRALHPDAGGDEALMKELNAARDLLK